MHAWILLGLFATAAVAGSNGVSTRYLDFGDSGQAKSLTADGKGNLFAAGQVTEPSGLRQIRVIKADSSGNPLASFDFGGGGGDTVAALATDSQGNLIVVGSTPSSDFPLVTPLNLQPRLPAGFVVKIDSQLQHILFSTLVGGMFGQYASATAVALDATDNLYVSGATDETDFPVTPNAFQGTVPAGLIGNNAYSFVMEISTQRQIVFSTYYSGTKPFCPPNEDCPAGHGNTIPASIALDSSGNVIVAGSTNQTDLPTTAGAYSQQCNCAQSGFIAKFASGGSKLIWATLVPPSAGPAPTLSIAGIALEPDGSVVAAGNVNGGLATTAGVLQAAPASTSQPSGFVSRVSSSRAAGSCSPLMPAFRAAFKVSRRRSGFDLDHRQFYAAVCGRRIVGFGVLQSRFAGWHELASAFKRPTARLGRRSSLVLRLEQPAWGHPVRF